MCYSSDITLFLHQLALAHPHNVLHFLVIIGVSLSEPHTRGTALRKCVNVRACTKGTHKCQRLSEHEA